MADPRFFKRAGPFTLADFAAATGGELQDPAQAGLVLHDVAPIDVAGEGHVSFLDNKKYVEQYKQSSAAACLIRRDMAINAPAGMALLLCQDPYRAYAIVAAMFYPPQPAKPGIAPSSAVDASARLGEGCQIDPGAVIAARAEIGPGSHIGANAVIGDGVIIGANAVIGANATISHAMLGDRVFIHPGVRIGQDGFGFSMGPAGHIKVPQLGRVIIHDDVEIGANSTVDRGAGPDTVIGAGCKIDKLVQIGHNVQLGRGCIMVAQSGISGSTKLGDFVIVAGQAGIIGHLTIGSGARVGAQSGVTRDVAPGETVGGSPAVPMTQWLRQSALLGQLAQKKGR